jgi:ABC-2 type transport system permease protein
MKLLSIFIKSLKEQVRSFWVLVLSLSMGPFFIFVYFLITESSKTEYKILIVNNDQGISVGDLQINHGNYLVAFFEEAKKDSSMAPFSIVKIDDRNEGIDKVKNKKADALIVLNGSFSQTLEKRNPNDSTALTDIELIGDLTNTNYLISAVWAGEIINQYTLTATNTKRLVNFKETPLGTSGNINYFDMVVPGLLIVSLIMLMFTASIAFVSEVENKTIMRLKLSNLSSLEFLGGISLTQSLVGIASVLLTLVTALLLGFRYEGSLLILVFIAGLTSLSIIAFSLIIAAVTKSATEVLVVGNFPMFLFMFFTGAAFPMKSNALFTIAGYPINFQGLMTPTHAISALNKTLVMNMSIDSILPEIISIIILTVIYFIIGAFIFQRRHLRLVQ